MKDQIFEGIFRLARNNAMLVMDDKGIILRANHAFLLSFGYVEQELTGKHFHFLFTEEDQLIGKPESEIDSCLTQGAANDDNYIVHKKGTRLWVAGESVKTVDGDGKVYIVKIIHVIHAQKLLERYLMESKEFVNAIFDSITDSGLAVIDQSMRIIKHNERFNDIFGLAHVSLDNRKLKDVHTQLQDPENMQTLRNMFVKAESGSFKTMELSRADGSSCTVSMRAKFITSDAERRMLLVFQEVGLG